MTGKDRKGEGLEIILSMALQRLTGSYLTIQRDVQVAFTAMVAATSIALIAIAGGVVGMYFGQIQVSLVMAAANVMSDTITVLFWRQYKDALQRMRQCQQDLLRVLLLMVAFEIAETIEEFQEQDGAKQAIIIEILKQ